MGKIVNMGMKDKFFDKKKYLGMVQELNSDSEKFAYALRDFINKNNKTNPIETSAAFTGTLFSIMSYILKDDNFLELCIELGHMHLQTKSSEIKSPQDLDELKQYTNPKFPDYIQ